MCTTIYICFRRVMIEVPLTLLERLPRSLSMFPKPHVDIIAANRMEPSGYNRSYPFLPNAKKDTSTSSSTNSGKYSRCSNKLLCSFNLTPTACRGGGVGLTALGRGILRELFFRKNDSTMSYSSALETSDGMTSKSENIDCTSGGQMWYFSLSMLV